MTRAYALPPTSPAPQGLRPWLLAASLALAGLAPALPTLAQPAPAAADGRRAYQIPAGPLTEALNAFGLAAGVPLGGAMPLTQGKTSPGLSGRYTVPEALAALLAGSGLAATRTPDGQYVLQPQASGPATLAPIAVVGASARDADAFVAQASGSALKGDTSLMETPRSVSVVTRAQMDARGATSMIEAVRYSAGVSTGVAGFDPRFDQISIRGFPVNTTGDYLDGLRQTPGSYAYFRTEPYALERVDIVKGPMSVLYGQGTPGGIVNRISKRPGPDPVHEIMLQGSTHDRKQAAFDIGDDINEAGTARFRVIGLMRRGDTERMIADDRDLFAPSFEFRLGENTTLTLLGQYMKDETDANVGNYVENGKVTKIRVSDPRYDHQRQTQYQAGYELEHRLGQDVTLRQQLRYGHIDLDARYLSGAGLEPGTRLLQRSAWSVESTLRNVSLDNNATVRFATGQAAHSLLAGFDYQWLKWDQGVGYLASGYPSLDLDNPQYGYVPGPTPPMNMVSVLQRNSQYGFYLSDQALLGNWRLTLGGRYDTLRQDKRNLLAGTPAQTKSDQAFTWQAGALYLADNGLAPYVNYSTSFTPNTSLTKSGDVLDPTHGEQIEAGIKYQPPGSHSYVTLAAYRIEEKDAARAVPGQPWSELAGTIRSTGIELEGLAELDHGLQLIASYSYNQGKVVKSNDPAEIGKVPSYQPRHLASLWLDYRLPQGPLAGLGLGAGARYVGASYGDKLNLMRNPAATLFDVSVSYEPGYAHPALKGWQARLSVQNLADKQVQACSGGYCYLGQGRQIVGSVRYKW
ncbi:Ferrichrome outer membrane transporter/phage receptor [Achromobacter insuavis]|uniref:TonB-dependent siderophore receptor n=1 Tax=Achromobacter insuavis TaxID=1287735 RepID=UPI001466F373|nr:TonB-dependent siderophore receptor [Achromobacter insuavis]CAB3887644.1 Ferrichrome outer membrane transporter/phage receptor [Achromobacter insuavis]